MLISTLLFLFLFLLSFVLIFSFWILLRMKKSVSHNLKTASQQFLSLLVMKVLGSQSLKSFERNSKNFKIENEKLLLSILKENSETEYGRRHSYKEIKDKKQFAKIVPLARYENFESLVRRIEKGEEGLLFGRNLKLRMLGTTSGTSGSIKLIPMVQKQASLFFFQGVCTAYATIFKHFPNSFSLQRGLKIMFNPKMKVNENKILIGPNSSNPKDSRSVICLYSSPFELYDLDAYKLKETQLYLHLLFALSDPNLGFFEANFSSSIHDLFVFLEKNHESLTQDILTGKLNQKVKETLSSEQFQTIQKLLPKPNPKRAHQIQKEFEKGFEGIIRRVWNNINYLLCCTTGFLFLSHFSCNFFSSFFLSLFIFVAFALQFTLEIRIRLVPNLRREDEGNTFERK